MDVGSCYVTMATVEDYGFSYNQPILLTLKWLPWIPDLFTLGLWSTAYTGLCEYVGVLFVLIFCMCVCKQL